MPYSSFTDERVLKPSRTFVIHDITQDQGKWKYLVSMHEYFKLSNLDKRTLILLSLPEIQNLYQATRRTQKLPLRTKMAKQRLFQDTKSFLKEQRPIFQQILNEITQGVFEKFLAKTNIVFTDDPSNSDYSSCFTKVAHTDLFQLVLINPI